VKGLRHQRGVALLAAILLVAIATVLAAAIAFESAMAARRGAASLSFDESVLVAEGAEALAASALRDAASTTGSTQAPDSFVSSWAQPLPPTEIVPGVMLQASLEGLEGRFNLNSLVARKDPADTVGTVDPEALKIFEQLLEMVGLETKWAGEIADWVTQHDRTLPDGLGDNDTTGQTPPYRVANTFITSTSELLALPEFGRERYLKLAPYVVALPPDAKINVCLASGFLLDAMSGSGNQYWSLGSALLEERKKQCWPTIAAYQPTVSAADWATLQPQTRLQETSNYFRLTSLITIGDTDFTLYSLLKRNATSGQKTVRVLQRSFTPD
jgi:general secretion pathway protein K